MELSRDGPLVFDAACENDGQYDSKMLGLIRTSEACFDLHRPLLVTRTHAALQKYYEPTKVIW
jgi:hypothetical protein